MMLRHLLLLVIIARYLDKAQGGRLQRLRQRPAFDEAEHGKQRDLFIRYRPGPSSENVCPAECPCCSALWPEFVRAVRGFSGDGSCYVRSDSGSNIVAIVNCAAADQPVAYFSFDYAQARGEPRYCGESRSDIEGLTRQEARACQSLLQGLARDAGVQCNDSFDCV